MRLSLGNKVVLYRIVLYCVVLYCIVLYMPSPTSWLSRTRRRLRLPMLQTMLPAMSVWMMLAMKVTLATTSTATALRVGVMLINDIRVPYGVHRVGPAVDVAMATVNRELLNSSYRLVSVLRVYDDICSARYATGRSRFMSHRHR